MKKKKMYKKLAIAFAFIAVISFFLFIFNENQEYVFNKIENLSIGSIKEYSLVEAKIYTCTIESPKNKTVVLRIDDITSWTNLDLIKRMTNDISSRGYGVTLGVIPEGTEKDTKLIKWLREINNDSYIELSQHGYDHSKEEFISLNYENAIKKINLGKEIMIRLFGEIPINFIPPYNIESEETIDALKDSGFKTFSGNINEYKIEEDFAKAGYTATTYLYSEDRFVSSEEVLSKCKANLEKTGVCIIMMHPQDFTDNGKVDEQKYAEFIKVLDGLKDLNANVVNFRQAFCEEY